MNETSPNTYTIESADTYRVYLVDDDGNKVDIPRLQPVIKVEAQLKGAPASWVEDEDIWEKAKEAVGPDDGSYDDYYAVVTDVYKEMGGKIAKRSKTAQRRPERQIRGNKKQAVSDADIKFWMDNNYISYWSEGQGIDIKVDEPSEEDWEAFYDAVAEDAGLNRDTMSTEEVDDFDQLVNRNIPPM